jgi:hypothetical protein
MCSIEAPPAGSTGSTGSRLAGLVERFGELGAEVAAMLADPALAAEIAALPADSLAGFVTSLASTVSAGTASLTVVTGAVDAAAGRSAGALLAGTYASTSRFLQVEAGMSRRTASATIARARDLRGDYAVVAEPWLTGRVSTDAVRELTVGVQGAMRSSGLPSVERDVARKAALEILLPVAETGTVHDVARVIGRLRLLTDEDGATQAALEAYDEQRLTVEQVGSMSRLTAWVTHEVAAAAMTVLERKVDTMRRDGDLAAEEQLPPGVDPETWDGRRQVNRLHGHLLAIAFGDTVTGLLDDNRVGSHHGMAPHVTVTVDVGRLEAGLGADLTMPGSDEPVLLTNETVRRILCDCALTTVVVRPFAHSSCQGGTVAEALLETSREVLYVGRAERVVPPRLRRALEVRDRHCRFPGCRAHVRRCHAHHVREWEMGGGTDLDNTVLLCVRHHHAVHEGGWVVRRVVGVPPGADGCWDVVPPERRRRP